MKKSNLLRLSSAILSLAFVISAAGCKSSNGKTVSSEIVWTEEEIVESGNNSGSSSQGGASESQADSKTSSASGSKTPSNASRQAFIESMPSKLKKTTIKVLFWDDLRNTVYKSALKEFQEKTGIKVEFEIASKSVFDQQLASRISAGKSPDLVKVIENNVSNVSNLQPITASGYDFNDSCWDTEIKRDFTFNGKCYAINVKDSPNRNIAILLYNKKALKRANMTADDPYTVWKKNPSAWTWSKVWSMCDNFVKANNNREGYYGITFGVEDGYPRCFKGTLWRYDSSKGKVVNCIKNNETVKAYETIVDAISKKWSTSTFDNQSFEAGKVLFSYSYSSISEKDNGGNSALIEAGNLGFVPIPTDSTVQPLFEYAAYGIPVGAKNAAAVPYLLRYIFSPDSVDSNSFYVNNEAKTVVEAMIKRGNFFFGNGYNYQIWQELISGTSSNVKSVLDSYSGQIDSTVAENNSNIAKLNK